MERYGESGMFELNQTGLNDIIIEYLVLYFQTTKGNLTPAEATSLDKDKYG